MKNKKTVWIPAGISSAAALVLFAYYLYKNFFHGGEAIGNQPPGEGGGEDVGGVFTTLGTIAIFTGAAGFSWF